MHIFQRGLAACGIFATVAVVNEGYFFTALRNMKIDCDKGSTHNADACIVDWIEAIVTAVTTVAFTGAAVVAAGFIPRDADYDDWNLAHVDGQAIHKWDVFHRGWMKNNLLDGQKKYILQNTTRNGGGGKVMSEVWMEDGALKMTSYRHVEEGQKRKRSREAYLHYSSEESDIKFEYPNIKTSYTYARDAAQHIFDDFANRHANTNCVGFEFHPPGQAFESAWVGVQGSYVKTNGAPNCLNPETNGGYSQIGDLYLTGY